ncbi:single-stranded DNA-binding protein [Fructobacillus tropaeoli]|uniref:single-stranded DNA-binding protein n=1 Tax=Fructobacillus tropaeoli TaxID=709323 RepID=UPI002D975445|nr:Single-stranded DNA-binding protein (Ssb) [Fructobacillus tropaeoli]
MQINHHVGRLVRPVKFRNLENLDRSTVAYLRLAVDGVKDQQTTFVDYVAFGKTAEVLSKLTTEKGDLVEVQFAMQNNEYMDPKTKTKVFNMQNVISRVKVFHTNKTSRPEGIEPSEAFYPTDFDAPVKPSSSSSENPFADFDSLTS